MNSGNQFLGTERMGKLMRQYAIPCIISLLVGALYNIVDQIFIVAHSVQPFVGCFFARNLCGEMRKPAVRCCDADKNLSAALLNQLLYTFYSSFSLPSSVTVTTCHGMNFPLFFKAVIAARSSPPQQGTSIRTTVTLLMLFSLIISVSFSE